jgi:hypothetical protein
MLPKAISPTVSAAVSRVNILIDSLPEYQR